MARRSRIVARGSARKTTWIGPADQGFVSVGTAGNVILSSFDPAANGLPQPTIVRSRGIVTVVPTVFPGDIEIEGAFGIAVVSDQAFAAGQASIPGPWTESGWDGWFVWGTFAVAYEEETNAGMMLSSVSQVVDSKAMRKVHDNETIVLMAEARGIAFRIAMQIRMLAKLS